MKKLFLLIGLVVFLIPLLLFGEDREKVLEQVKKNNKALALYYYDMKHNPPKACLSNEEVIKIAKKCKVPFKDQSQLFSMTIRELYWELSSGLNCSGYSIFAPEGYSDGYKCDRINTRMSCFEKRQKKAKSKKNCKKPTPEDYGFVERIYPKMYDELAILLGCGIERKDADDCVRRYLPSIIGSGPLTLEQVDLIKRNWGVLDEIIVGIEEMNRAQNQSNKPSQQEQEQARSEEGYYAEQSDGEWVWVDTRSGYEQFTDKWCIGCSPLKVYWINRAATKHFQGGYLSGYEKFILRGTNFNKVIKIYK